MKKEVSEKRNLILWAKTAVLEIIVTAVFIFAFSAVMYFLNLSNELSPVLATVSVALGVLVAAFYAAKKVGSKGYLVGLAVGGITFLIILLISLVVDSGGITINTVFHLIIIMLAALIGGISGVNKRGKKYI